MDITKEHIENYLMEVKDAIQQNRYQIARNKNRPDNNQLFYDYVIDETMAKDILLGLTALDFSEMSPNDHKGFEYEMMYVFGKDVELLERFGQTVKTVSLYIKFNKLDNCYVIVVSMHEQKYPLKYYFKK